MHDDTQDLLICGIVSSLLYVAMNVFVPMQWEGYSPWSAANQVTLAKILLPAELARRLSASSVSANCVYPGAVRTELQWKLPWLYGLIVLPIRLFFQSPSQGAAGPVFLASAPEMAYVSGGYFERARQVLLPPDAVDPHSGGRLWEIAETMTAISERGE